MKKIFRATLKTRLASLILLAFAPAFALAIFNSIQQLNVQEETAKEASLRLARVMKISQHQLVADAKEFLRAIATTSLFDVRNGENCEGAMNRLADAFPSYVAFGVVRTSGDVQCSADRLKLSGNISHLSFFQDAISKRTVSVGPYEMDPSTNKPTVFLGYPLFDEQKEVRAVVFTALDLSSFDKLPAAAALPAGSIVNIFDKAGLILARYPDPKGWAGSYRPEAPLLLRIQSTEEEGVVDSTGLDGVERLYAYTTLHRAGNQVVFLVVGVPANEAYGEARQSFQVDLLSLVVVSLLVLGIAWIGSDRLVVRKVRILAQAADRIRRGDLSARSGLRDDPAEVGQLASAVDNMAAAIQDRVHALQQHTHEMHVLRDMNEALESCVTRDEVLAIVRQFAQQLFPRQPGTLYLLHDSGDYLEARTSWGSPVSKKEFLPQDCWAVRRAKLYYVEAGKSQARCHHVHQMPPVSYVCVPLLAQGEMLGILHLENDALFPVDESEPASQALAEAAAGHIAFSLANLKLRDILHAQAMRDGLTGLFNRRYMEETLIRETRIADRSRGVISIIMLDIDHFKRFNDTFGHAAGDALLREIGKMMQTQMRGSDLACRYGGEEFTIILPGTNLQHAAEIAEKLRVRAMDLHITVENKTVGDVTISLGVACYPMHGGSWQAVLHAADIALLRAKQRRNRVVVSPEKELLER